MRYHTRINLSPSGIAPELSATVGNLVTARANMEIGRNSGGTFVVQFDDLLVYNTSIGYRCDRRPYEEAVLSQLSHYGVSPSPPDLLQEFDVLVECRVARESEWAGQTDFAWRHLLPRFRQVFGDWPPPYPVGTHSGNEALTFSTDQARAATAAVHPYVITSRVVMDAAARRTAFLNGDDCRETRALYAAIVALLGLPPVEQYTVPLLRHTPGESKVSVSSDPAGNPFYIVKCQQAGLTYHELWGYLEAVMCKSSWPQTYDPLGLLSSFRPWPVIDTKHWQRFLKASTKRRQVMIDEVKAR